MMALHTAAVVKGAPKKFVVADLPFMSYRKGLSENMTAIEQIMKAGPQAVKLKALPEILKLLGTVLIPGFLSWAT
jgi:3-methyl-2-oxobutanoate hydroxymethyltransferase